MLNLMMAMFHIRMGEKIACAGGAFQSHDLADAAEHFPEHILPARRKKRPYISSILSKNEVSREDKYNRKHFLRVKHGHHIVNPGLNLRADREWRKIYELLSFDMISHAYIERLYTFNHDISHVFQHSIKLFSDRIERYVEQGYRGEFLTSIDGSKSGGAYATLFPIEEFLMPDVRLFGIEYFRRSAAL